MVFQCVSDILWLFENQLPEANSFFSIWHECTLITPFKCAIAGTQQCLAPKERDGGGGNCDINRYLFLDSVMETKNENDNDFESSQTDCKEFNDFDFLSRSSWPF